MKTTIIHHSADFDGHFCGRIAKKFMPEAEVIGWDFGDPPVGLDIFKDGGLVYILDLPVDRVFGFDFKAMGASPVLDDTIAISQPGSQIRAFLEACKRVVWIDHHASSIATHPTDLAGYRIDGVAACRLAWQWFTLAEHNAQHATNDVMQIPLPNKEAFIDRNIPEPLAVRLAGEYDVWDKRDPDAEVFQFALRSQELTDDDWYDMLSDNLPEVHGVVLDLMKNGHVLQRYQQRNDANVVNYRSFILSFDGLRFLALNTARCNSLTFAAKDVPETGHDALMGFYWTGQKWKVSLYHAKHRTDLDLSQIAVNHGGGGHRGACGFEASLLPFTL